MTSPISNTSSVSNAQYNADVSTGASSATVSTLPHTNSDPLTTMLSSGDIGSAVAAMVMINEKNNRDSARNARDTAYKSMAAEQQKELTHMQQAADRRFVTGIVQGSTELAGAGCTLGGSFASSTSGAKAQWQAASEGCHATDTLTGAFGKAGSDAADRRAKADGQHADEFKRIAEDHKDDLDDANKAIDKATQFYQDWIGARSSEQQAALHRS